MSGIPVEEFSALVGHIYDAAVAPAEWPRVLERIRKSLNAQTAALWSYDIFDRTPPWQLEIGYDPHWMKLYTEKYLALNPYMDQVTLMSPGDVLATSGLPDYPELFNTEFYQGWLKPQRFIDASQLMIEKSMNTITTLSSVRNEDQGIYDDAALDLLRLLYPHLRRAVLIGRVVREHQDRAAEYSELLDSLSAGMFLVSDRAEVIHANASGNAMLAARAPLKKVNGRLVLVEDQANRSLREAIAAAQQGDVVLGEKGTSIPIRSENADFILHMLPLNAARRKSVGFGDGAANILFVTRTDPKDATALAAFAERFGLTAQEGRVLQAILEVGGVPMAADILGISPNTARTHVTSIFNKTGVRRQADLIRLLIETKSPFARADGGSTTIGSMPKQDR
jgi:DNA-binding CsgD family transcriptional regulator